MFCCSEVGRRARNGTCGALGQPTLATQREPLASQTRGTVLGAGRRAPTPTPRPWNAATWRWERKEQRRVQRTKVVKCSFLPISLGHTCSLSIPEMAHSFSGMSITWTSVIEGFRQAGPGRFISSLNELRIGYYPPLYRQDPEAQSLKTIYASGGIYTFVMCTSFCTSYCCYKT